MYVYLWKVGRVHGVRRYPHTSMRPNCTRDGWQTGVSIAKDDASTHAIGRREVFLLGIGGASCWRPGVYSLSPQRSPTSMARLPSPPLLARAAQRLFFTQRSIKVTRHVVVGLLGGVVHRYCGACAHTIELLSSDRPILYVRGCSLALASDDSINGNPRRRPGTMQ